MSSRRAPASSRWRSRQPVLRDAAGDNLVEGTVAHGRQAVPDADRHQHGGAGGSGTVALMLQANPSLTPNLVKAILQYTAQAYGLRRADPGRRLPERARRRAARAVLHDPPAGAALSDSGMWSRQIIWGNQRLSGGVLKPAANAWANNVVWGTRRRPGREHRLGHALRDDCENIVWGTVADEVENIVWGTLDDGENIVWGTADDGENIVWGDGRRCENIVWGTACGSRSTARTSCGARRSTSRTSCGARSTMARTSCGARTRPREHRVGHERRRPRRHRLGLGGRGRGRDVGQQR